MLKQLTFRASDRGQKSQNVNDQYDTIIKAKSTDLKRFLNTRLIQSNLNESLTQKGNSVKKVNTLFSLTLQQSVTLSCLKCPRNIQCQLLWSSSSPEMYYILFTVFVQSRDRCTISCLVFIQSKDRCTTSCLVFIQSRNIHVYLLFSLHLVQRCTIS